MWNIWNQHKFSPARVYLAIVFGLALSCAAWLSAAEDTQTPGYPDGFRTWVHVKTAIVTAAHPAYQSEGGIHHIYANRQAAEGYSTGKFPDGSMIVYELLSTEEKDGVISEGGQRRVDVMVKDSTHYAATGGWGFNRFFPEDHSAGSLTGSAGARICFECHRAAGARDSVFSRLR